MLDGQSQNKMLTEISRRTASIGNNQDMDELDDRETCFNFKLVGDVI